ncbi:hypothetical protein D3C85_1119480 [compost metagenome]
MQHHAGQLVARLGVGLLHTHAHPVQVELDGRQDGAQFVVEFPGQPGLLVLGHALQVGRQRGQLPRTRAHLAVEPGAFLLQLDAGRLGHRHPARMAEPDRDQQQDVDRRQQADAVARELQVMLGRLQVVRHGAGLARLQLLQPAPGGFHGLAAEIGADQVHRHVHIALAVDQRQGHLVELAGDELGRLAKLAQALGVVGVVLADAGHQCVDLRQRLVVRLQIAVLAGQQETALARLGVDEFAHQRAQVTLQLLRADGFGIALAQAQVARLRGNQDGQGQHDAAGEQQGISEK